MQWYGIIIDTKSAAVDLIADALYDLGVKGIEIIEPTLDREDRERLFVDYIDDNLKATDAIQIKCYFSFEEDINEKCRSIRSKLDDLASFVDIGAGTIEVVVTKEEDWANNWKQYYKPFRIGKNILIKPTWEVVEDIKPQDIIIDIDPGMAFGSGTHETTSMCTLLIQKYIRPMDYVIDVGCGSGILSIVAARLGASQVDAIDIDPVAVKVALENAKINDLTEKINVMQGNLVELCSKKADIVVANIMADVIVILVDDIKRVLKDEGVFISSGIITDKKDEVIDKLQNSGFDIVEVSQDKDWVAITAKLKVE